MGRGMRAGWAMILGLFGYAQIICGEQKLKPGYSRSDDIGANVWKYYSLNVTDAFIDGQVEVQVSPTDCPAHPTKPFALYLQHGALPTKIKAGAKALVAPWVVKSWVITKTGLWYAGLHGTGIKGIKRCQFFIKGVLRKAQITT